MKEAIRLIEIEISKSQQYVNRKQKGIEETELIISDMKNDIIAEEILIQQLNKTLEIIGEGK
jgi:hypothetical protein